MGNNEVLILDMKKAIPVKISDSQYYLMTLRNRTTDIGDIPVSDLWTVVKQDTGEYEMYNDRTGQSFKVPEHFMEVAILVENLQYENLENG